MSLRIIGSGLLVLSFVFACGCRHQSSYRANCEPPCVSGSPAPVVTGTPPAGAAVMPVPAH